ncbi:RDD family protein [Candidatus Bipolaricaulota sp. J31]
MNRKPLELLEGRGSGRHRVAYAGLWSRFLALAADFCLFLALFLPITRLVKGVWIMGASDHRWARGLFITDPLCLAFLGAMFLYFVVLEGLAGATLGKRLLGLRVVRVDGRRPGLLKAAVRNALRLVDGLPALNLLGVVLILRSEERARFGDRVAGTRVVHAGAYEVRLES